MPNRTINLANLEQFTAVTLLSDPGAIGGPYVVPSCARIILMWTLESGKVAHIILLGRYAGAFTGSPAQAESIFDALTTGAQWTALASFLATSTSFANVGLQDVNTPNNTVITRTFGDAKPGTSVSASLPNEVSVVVTKRSAKSGRANRGRMYLSGFATNALGTGNVIAPAAVTAVGDWANTIAGALSAQGYTHVIGQPARKAYEGSTGTQHPARPAGSVDVTSLAIRDNHWDSQRRRGLR